MRSSRVHEATQDWADDTWQADWRGGWPDAWNEAAEPGDAVWTADTPQTVEWSQEAVQNDQQDSQDWQDQPADESTWQPEGEATDWQPEGEDVLEAALAEIADCYSVTATKLKGITLGRGWNEKGGVKGGKGKGKGKSKSDKGGKSHGKNDKGKTAFARPDPFASSPATLIGQFHSRAQRKGGKGDKGKTSFRGVSASSPVYVAETCTSQPGDHSADYAVSTTKPVTLSELVASGVGPASPLESHDTLVAVNQLLERAGRTRDEAECFVAEFQIPTDIWEHGPEVWRVFSAEAPDEDPLYMVIDTACQKSCHGTHFDERMAEQLAACGLQTFSLDSAEPFRFGISRTISNTTSLWPAMFDDVPLVISQLILENPNLPFLGSLVLFDHLDMVLHTRRRCVSILRN